MNRITRNILAFLGGAAGIIAIVMMMAPTGGLPSRPRFLSAGLNIAAPAGNGSLSMQGVNPETAYIESDAAADNRRWYVTASGETFAAGTRLDNGSFAAEFLTVNRTAGTVDTIAFAANSTTSFANDVIMNDTGIALDLSSISPRMFYDDTDAGANQRITQCSATGTTFQCGTLDDGGGAGTNWLAVTRSGTTVSSLNLVATAVQANGVAVARTTVTETAISGAGMLVGDTITISKVAATSRANNAVDSNDGDLQVTSLPAGHYLVDYQVNLNAGAGGARYRLEAPTAASTLYGVNNCASTVTAVNGAFDGLVQCAGTLRAYGSGASAKVQATGTVAISWAQNTSNAANTTLEADSYLRVKRID